MSALSDELRDKLARLRAGRVSFDPARQCLVDSADGARKRGLTRVLAQLLPVPFDKLDDETEAALTRRARTSKYDPETRVEVRRFESGATLRRCGSCDGALRFLRASKLSVGARLRAEPNGDKAHGVAVDYQLSLYVRRGRAALFKVCGAFVDPCVGTVLEQCDALGWALVATQVPVYSSAMDIATAIDLLATDRATRTKLYLIELKASRGRDAVARANLQYERLRGRLQRTTLRGFPLSYYSRHQMQLFCMDEMVRSAHDFRFDGALVMRVAPGVSRLYRLNEYYSERAKRIVRAIGLKTGKVRAVQRKRRQLKPDLLRGTRKRKRGARQ
jgi:hypothetical protein